MMTSLATKTFAPLIVLILLCSSCTAITHVDEFEVAADQCEQEALHLPEALICYEDISPEIKTCMDQEFNLNFSDECAYCRCTKCDIEIRECGLRCWEIVACAIINQCVRGNIASCVTDKCAPVLDRAQAGIEQASALSVCIGSCNDICLSE